MALCTDNFGILNTTLSREYAITEHTFRLGQRRLRQLALAAVDVAFLSAEERAALKSRMQACMPEQEEGDAAVKVAAAVESPKVEAVSSAAVAVGRPAARGAGAKGGSWRSWFRFRS